MASELTMWKMLAVMPSVTCSIRRRDFAVSTDGCRNGVLRNIKATNISNCSFAAQRLSVNLVEATRQLDIATNGLTGVVDAEADE